MTSKNLSLTEKLKNHHKYISRTLWTSYIALPFMAAYYVIILIMMLSRCVGYARMYHQSAEVLFQEKIRAVSRVIGMGQLGWILAAAIAFMFAFQGFPYIFNQSQLDFYMSQPTTRADRVRKNIFNAISTFSIMYVGVEVIALIVAAIYGAVTPSVIAMVLIETVRTIIFFIAIYNITVLAILLSGTIPVAVLLSFFFYLITPLLAAEVKYLKELFFDTYSYFEKFNVLASPLFDRVETTRGVTGSLLRGTSFLEPGGLGKCLEITWTRDLDTLIVAFITIVLVGICSRARQAEWAGKSIVYRPFRWFVKVTVGVAVGIAAGLMVSALYSETIEKNTYVLMFVVMLLACLFASVIVEIIMQRDVRAFAKGLPQNITALAIVALVFLIFRGDLIGYDSFIPNASRVESCAIFDYEETMHLYDDNNNNVYDDYEFNHMCITDIDKFLKLAKLGMSTRNYLGSHDEKELNDYPGGCDFDIVYRMKSGRKIYRSINIPLDVDPALMDSIFSSKEFIEGAFPIFDDERFAQDSEESTRNETSFTNINGCYSSYNVPYRELAAALREDISQHYNYSELRNTLPIGEVEFLMSGRKYGNLIMTIYESYTNTIEVLKKYDIYRDNVIDPEEIERVEVTDYFVGYDEEEIKNIDDYSEIVDEVVGVYESPEEIREIINSILASPYSGKWYDYDSVSDTKYGVTFYRKHNLSSYDGEIYATFLKGKVPDFVIRDTKK